MTIQDVQQAFSLLSGEETTALSDTLCAEAMQVISARQRTPNSTDERLVGCAAAYAAYLYVLQEMSFSPQIEKADGLQISRKERAEKAKQLFLCRLHAAQDLLDTGGFLCVE